MVQSAGTAPASAAGLSTSLVVVLGQAGLSVPVPDGWSLPVDLARLSLLERLAAGAADVDAAMAATTRGLEADPMALAMFVQSLRTARLLTATPTNPAAAPPPAPRAETTPEAGASFAIDAPLVFAIAPDGFRLHDHDGRLRTTLSAPQVEAATAYCEPVTLADAYALHRAAVGERAFDEAAFAALTTELLAAGALRSFDQTKAVDVVALGVGRLMARNEARAYEELLAVMDRHVARHEARQDEWAARTGRRRTKVVPVTFNGTMPPLALGLLVSYAMVYEGGRLQEHYDFHPGWLTDEARLAELARTPSVFLFSNYVWSHERCLQASELVKSVNPDNITVHGGPSTPKYENDVEEYLARYPHIDVVARGEGEVTTADLLAALVDGDGIALDPERLAGVEGISFRTSGGVVRTPDRDRLEDLDSVPSPYLTGLFEPYSEVPRLSATLETNRGCPYGCTFCDWGSATLSRIRKFDLDRVMAELEWCAENQVISVGLTDANFGIWERDVAITEKIVELKRETGFPTGFGANYAKNTSKHLKHIISMLVEAGIISQGVLALQSMDTETLVAIERSNIKLEKYEELAREFRRSKLPLFVDLMVGLPGQTLSSFENDLQECADREVQARLPITQMLVNSPMNDPAYREKHKIELTASPVGPEQPRVVATSTFTREEYEEMLDLRSVFILVENLGVLRQVGRYVRQEVGIREVDLYHRMLRDVVAEPERWPYLHLALKMVPIVMAPPVSWAFMIDDLRSYLVEVVGVRDDSGLATVLAVQHALLPGRDRTFPVTVPLEHDYVAWFDAVQETKEQGHRHDWADLVPRLTELPPGTLVVDDPRSTITSSGIGAPFEFHGTGLHWELQSALARVDVQEDETIESLIVST